MDTYTAVALQAYESAPVNSIDENGVVDPPSKPIGYQLIIVKDDGSFSMDFAVPDERWRTWEAPEDAMFYYNSLVPRYSQQQLENFPKWSYLQRG